MSFFISTLDFLCLPYQNIFQVLFPVEQALKHELSYFLNLTFKWIYVILLKYYSELQLTMMLDRNTFETKSRKESSHILNFVLVMKILSLITSTCISVDAKEEKVGISRSSDYHYKMYFSFVKKSLSVQDVSRGLARRVCDTLCLSCRSCSQGQGW